MPENNVPAEQSGMSDEAIRASYLKFQWEKLLNDVYMHFRILLPRIRASVGNAIQAQGGVTAHYVLIDKTTGLPATADTPLKNLAGRAGFAVCHPADNYNKATGRKLAKERSSDGKVRHARQWTSSRCYERDAFASLRLSLMCMARAMLNKVINRELRKTAVGKLAWVSYLLLGSYDLQPKKKSGG